MENKEIYIDGVDVSGCENYIGVNTKTCNCTLYDGYLRPCKNADCYYKNWKRKEQECEELKNFHINLVGVKECEIKELAELKAENKHLNDLLNQALKELEKTRETLTEIKEIAENLAFIDNDDVVLDILQKFSESEGNGVRS